MAVLGGARSATCCAIMPPMEMPIKWNCAKPTCCASLSTSCAKSCIVHLVCTLSFQLPYVSRHVAYLGNGRLTDTAVVKDEDCTVIVQRLKEAAHDPVLLHTRQALDEHKRQTAGDSETAVGLEDHVRELDARLGLEKERLNGRTPSVISPHFEKEKLRESVSNLARS